MHETLEEEIRRVLAGMDNQDNQEPETQIPETIKQETEPDETIHIHYFPDAIVILKEEEPEDTTVVETTLAQTNTTPVFVGYAVCSFYLFLILSCIAFQLYLILNPPIATVTIIPKS